MYYYKDGWDNDPEIFFTEDGDGTVSALDLIEYIILANDITIRGLIS